MKKSSIILGTFIAIIWTVGSVAALTPAPDPFKDVPSDHWALFEVDWAKTFGIVEGFKEDDTFRGNNNTTRYELVKVLSNYDEMLRDQMDYLKKEVTTLKQEVTDLNLAIDTDYFPVDDSELAPGATSYLVCKSAEDDSRIYTTSFPYPPFDGKRYDEKGNLIEGEVEVKDCVRTTKYFYDLKVND